MTTTQDSTQVTAPFTGAEYLESLRDGRTVYMYGESVRDVTTHPAFRNTARSMAKLYDALHDPEYRDVLTMPTDTGKGGFTHRFFPLAALQADLVGSRDAIAAWCRLSYGFMGRTPDFTATLGDLRTSTRSTPATRGPGTSGPRSRSRSSTTPSSTRRSIAMARPTTTTSTSGSSRRPTTASSSAARRWSRPRACSPTTRSSRTSSRCSRRSSPSASSST